MILELSMRLTSRGFGRLSVTVRAAGISLVSVALALGLVALAAAQPPFPVWRAATPINSVFMEQFASGLTPEVDLRSKIRQFGLPVRNQGNRGTCTVFAT